MLHTHTREKKTSLQTSLYNMNQPKWVWIVIPGRGTNHVHTQTLLHWHSALVGWKNKRHISWDPLQSRVRYVRASGISPWCKTTNYGWSSWWCRRSSISINRRSKDHGSKSGRLWMIKLASNAKFARPSSQIIWTGFLILNNQKNVTEVSIN